MGRKVSNPRRVRTPSQALSTIGPGPVSYPENHNIVTRYGVNHSVLPYPELEEPLELPLQWFSASWIPARFISDPAQDPRHVVLAYLSKVTLHR